MNKEMTSRERIVAAMKREDIDRVPCSPFFNPQDPVQRRGKTYNFPFGPSHREAVEYGVEKLGLDMVVNVGWPTYYPGPGVSSSVELDGDTLKKTWQTPAGRLECAVKHDENWPHGFDIPLFTDYTIGRFRTPWVENARDVECLSHILLPPRTEEHRRAIEFAWLEARRLADRYDLAIKLTAGTGLTGAHQLWDTERLCLAAFDDPGLIDAYLDLEHRLTLEHYTIALDLGVDIIRRNGFYESCDFFSPDFLRRMLGARLREEAEVVHQAGKVIGYTMLTGYTPLADHLGATGIDCLIVPDPFFRGEQPQRLTAELGDRMSFWTGPSDTIQMPWDDQEAVRKAVRDTFSIFGRLGLILTVCSSAKAPHPWANALAMIDEWKKLR
jgi:hypothetical protein